MRHVVYQQDVLRWLTAEVIARRFALENERKTRMALELKGLKGKALKGASVIDRINRAWDKLIETGEAHAADVEGLAPQIDQMHEDITFSAQMLGNSVGASGATAEPPKADEAPAANGQGDWPGPHKGAPTFGSGG